MKDYKEIRQSGNGGSIILAIMVIIIIILATWYFYQGEFASPDDDIVDERMVSYTVGVSVGERFNISKHDDWLYRDEIRLSKSYIEPYLLYVGYNCTDSEGGGVDLNWTFDAINAGIAYVCFYRPTGIPIDGYNYYYYVKVVVS